MRDITKQKQAEQKAFDAKLQQERVNILMGFIQDASHEFRTPLAIIQSSLYLMSKKDDAEYRAGKVTQIERQIDRLTHLLDMLLTMTQLDSGIDFDRVPTDVSSVVREVISDREADFAEKSLTVELDLADVPTITADPRHLTEAIHQLLDNALHFTPESGTITLQTTCTDDAVMLQISDTGTGIAEKDMPHLFERFYRADTAHTKSGFGLGLAIAHKVATEHDGTITVANRAEGGCVVTITLPRHSEEK
jgi:signal transduction histidine kinase